MEINLSIIFWVPFPDFHVSCTNSAPWVQEIRKKIEDLDFQLPENMDQEIVVCRIQINGMACTTLSPMSLSHDCQ